MAKMWGGTLEELQACLPASAVKALIARFGGHTIRIPRQLRESRQARTRRVLAALDERSYRAAADATAVPVRTVKRYAKRAT